MVSMPDDQPQPANEANSASVALISSTVRRDIADIIGDVAKLALDAELHSELLKEIPFFSWLIKIGAIGASIRDRIFIKKVAMFLLEGSRLSSEERNSFAKRLATEPDLEQRTGETALFLLEKVTSPYKARLMGYALRRFAQGHIDEVTLNRIYAALEFVPLWRLIDLPEYYFDGGLGPLGQDAAAAYQTLGLIEIYYGDKGKRLHCDFVTQGSYMLAYHQPSYRRTEIGLKVAEIIRDYLNEPD